MSLGIVIVLIAALGYLSNTLNWRYLNFSVIRLLYYIGALVHETSHAVLCILTGAKIEEFTVFSDQPQVVHRPSKIPFLGELLISAAPIAGGLLFYSSSITMFWEIILRCRRSRIGMIGKASSPSRWDF